jgi:DNA repair protein RecO (recombination protein O)
LSKRIETAALLVRGVPYGEADLVATFFTETDGKLGAIVRGARKSTKRFGGALEPMHEIVIVLEDKGRELGLLKEARVVRPRLGLTSDLDAMEAAGRALRWVRHLCPARTPEPEAWSRLRGLLDRLDAGMGEVPILQHLATFGLHLLADVGYALEWERCVRCGRPCPPGRSAMIDAAGGGLVCTSCGGARRTVAGDVREVAVRAQRDEDVTMTNAQANDILAIVDDALAAHADFDPAGKPR